jgi:UDP-2-acetamido-2,6-beta-L-arabino-hexul-4-ose reductase
MEAVSAGYEGLPVVEQVTLEAPAGEITALVGPSGQGKSTLMRLMLGLIPPREGSVALTDSRGEQYPLGPDTRSLLTYVPQGNTVLAGTVAENLRLVNPNATREEMIAALEGKPHRCEFEGVNTVLTESGRYCAAPISHKVTLGEIVALLDAFKAQPATLTMPEIPHNSFAKKLYSTYLSYLPREKAIFPLKMNVDDRGSFTELLKTEKCGQFSVNISKPGITKGQHWHHTKWEFFIVVSGRGLIQQRKVGTEEVLNFEVSGEKIEAIHMLPGYTHNIINLSDTDDLVTVMWANECFDPNKPDTFFEKVES